MCVAQGVSPGAKKIPAPPPPLAVEGKGETFGNPATQGWRPALHTYRSSGAFKKLFDLLILNTSVKFSENYDEEGVDFVKLFCNQ